MRRARVGLALALVWAAVVTAVYYRQLWWLIAAGPSAWSIPELGQSLRYSGVPWAYAAMLRAVSGIGAAVVVALATWTAGRLSARWMVPADASAVERPVIELATGAGVFAYALFALALAGWFVPSVVSALTVALAAVGCIVASAGARDQRAVRSAFRQSSIVAVRRAAASPWLSITFAACAIAFLCALAPEHEYDALWYHLELPRRWLQAGRPVDDVNEYVSLYPLTWELLFGAALSLDGDVAAKLVHWITLPLSALIAGWLVRRIDPRTPPALAAAVVVTAPTVLWEATTAYVDLALAFHAALAAYALVRAHDGGSRRWITVAAVQLGLCCATKHVGLLVLAATLAVWLAVGLRRGAARGGTLASAALMAIVALAIATPWYVRAALASGNPVFPELYGVFGAWPPERWNPTVDHALAVFKDHFGRPRTALNVLGLPWDMTMHAASYGGTFGPLLLAVLPFAGLSMARSRTALALGSGAIVYFALWASPISSFQMRFLVPFWIVAAPIVAGGIQRMIDACGAVRAPLGHLAAAGVAALLVLDLPPATPLHEGDRVEWSGWLTHVIHDLPVAVVAGGISREQYLDREVRTAAAWRWIDTNTPKGARILTLLGGDQFLAHRARLWSETPTARPVTWDAPAGRPKLLAARLRRLGIEYVLVQKPLLRTPAFDRLEILRPAVLSSQFEVAYEDFWMVVYRLRPDGAANP